MHRREAVSKALGTGISGGVSFWTSQFLMINLERQK